MTREQRREQKAAIQNYWRTVASQDRYLGSVFVKADMTAYYERLVSEVAAKCAALGVAQ